VLLFLLIAASGPSPVTGKNSLVTFTAKLTVKPGREQAFEITMRGVVPKVQEESRNRAYLMCRAKENPRVFLFFEEYVDQVAVEAHR
jgi:quinol monooxygenase YgiN